MINKRRVLICDDDTDILEVCRVILSKKNYEVLTSTDCESIFDKLKDLNPGIILMDLWIPVMGGEMCTRKLKENADSRNIPIILFSANNEVEQIAHRVKADGYLKKPFDIKDLAIIIEKYYSSEE